MSVFYKRVKGCAAGASLTSGLWTYLTWGTTYRDSDSIGEEVLHMPTLSVAKGKEDDDNKRVNLGYLLTNEMPTPYIRNQWNFSSILFQDSEDSTSAGTIESGTGFFYRPDAKPVNLPCAAKAIALSGNLSISGILDIQESIHINRLGPTTDVNLEVYGKSSFNGNVYIDTGHLIVSKGYGRFEQYCQAEYFNAVSDMRAKEEICKATYSALELINKLPIYNFKYKNKEEKVTGILAQDLLEAQPEGLDLVSNINATGENGDYMSIKNDKLMFVLMKAIQEQQEQIEALKAEIEKLKA